jgi:hypothetical protein
MCEICLRPPAGVSRGARLRADARGKPRRSPKSPIVAAAGCGYAEAMTLAAPCRSARDVTMRETLQVLTPDDSRLVFIDQQPQMAFGVEAIDRRTLENNTVALAMAAEVFAVPTTIRRCAAALPPAPASEPRR